MGVYYKHSIFFNFLDINFSASSNNQPLIANLMCWLDDLNRIVKRTSWANMIRLSINGIANCILFFPLFSTIKCSSECDIGIRFSSFKITNLLSIGFSEATALYPISIQRVLFVGFEIIVPTITKAGLNSCSGKLD